LVWCKLIKARDWARIDGGHVVEGEHVLRKERSMKDNVNGHKVCEGGGECERTGKIMGKVKKRRKCGGKKIPQKKKEKEGERGERGGEVGECLQKKKGKHLRGKEKKKKRG